MKSAPLHNVIRRRAPFLAVLALALSSGCLTVSLHEFYLPGDIVREPVIAGTWVPERDTAVWTFVQRTDHGYELKYVENGSPASFDAVLFEAGGRQFLDLHPDKLPAMETSGSPCRNELFFIPMVRGHLLFRVRMSGDSLQLEGLADEWVKKQPAVMGKVRVETVDQEHVLTGPSTALHAFVKRIAANDKAFDTPYLLLRRR